MNFKRILTALIGFPVVAAIFIFGSKYIVDIVVMIIALIGMNEYIKCISKKVNVISWISYLFIACMALIHIIPAELIQMALPFVLPVLMLVLFLHVIISDMKISFEQIAYTLFGILYIFGFLVFIPLVYGFEGEVSGKLLIWFVLFASWGTDVFAYFIGCKIGKHKFSKVSPKKSIEGCIAGIFGAVILTLIFSYILNNYFDYSFSYLIMGISACVLSIIGQIGDFSASVVKRSFDIKDFSELFPGHGGMLDRIDSVMFIAPFAYLLFMILF